jgi:hypothetical protein
VYQGGERLGTRASDSLMNAVENYQDFLVVKKMTAGGDSVKDR